MMIAIQSMSVMSLISRMRGPLRRVSAAGCSCGLLSLVLVVACGCEKSYDQSSAEGTFYSMIGMVQDGNVDRLPELIQADDPQVQQVLDRVGVLLGRLYQLQQTIEKQHPEALAEFIEETEERYSEAAAQRAEEAGQRRGRRGWGENIRKLMADPFGTWDEELGRLSVTYVSDDLYAITRDGQPLFGVGVTIERAEDGKWYFSWPDTIPGLDVGMPRSDAEWQVVNNMLISVRNGLNFAEERVHSGTFRSLQEIWEQIGREVMFQVGGQAVLYGRLMEMREKEEQEAAKAPSDEGNSQGKNASDGDATPEQPPTGTNDAVVGQSG